VNRSADVRRRAIAEVAMELLVIRHGVAESREAFAATGKDDAERPLTEEGRRDMKRAAKGLRRVVRSIDVLGSSPLVRAMQTANIVAEQYGEIAVSTVSSLVPDSQLDAFVSWLRHQRPAKVVAVVGHEPHLSMLVTWLLTGLAESRVRLRKGGACLLEFSGHPDAGGGVLSWALTPSILRLLAD
jgi:phosphohistidine phosphatase